ncbi:hypothetical protein ACWDRB_63310 [Nonomuraea sp. NPDC003707]
MSMFPPTAVNAPIAAEATAADVIPAVPTRGNKGPNAPAANTARSTGGDQRRPPAPVDRARRTTRARIPARMASDRSPAGSTPISDYRRTSHLNYVSLTRVLMEIIVGLDDSDDDAIAPEAMPLP